MDHHWRLTVRFESSGHAHKIFSALKTHAAAALAAEKLKDGAVALRDGEWLRIYADSDAALRRAQTIVGSALEAEGVRAEEQAEHRAGEDEDWQTIELPPVPEREEKLVGAHEGKGPWGSEAEPDRVQAHFQLPTRRAARACANELASEGYDVHQAESFVFIFADDGAAARRLGASLMERAPAGVQLYFEGEGRTVFF